MSAIVRSLEYSLALPFFGIEMKADLFQSCGHCWVFQICWHISCSTFTASSFRFWNRSTGILSPPLTLFIVMLSKAHLTSHSRVSGCMMYQVNRNWSKYATKQQIPVWCRNFIPIKLYLPLFCAILGFSGGSVVKNLSSNVGDVGLIPGLGRFPGRGNGSPFQYSCLENPIDRGGRQAMVHRVAKSQTWLSHWVCTYISIYDKTNVYCFNYHIV